MSFNQNKIKETRLKQARPIHIEGELENYLKNSFQLPIISQDEVKWKMLVLLFARPGSQLGGSTIIPNLDYVHHLTDDHIDFFCVGYHKLDANTEKVSEQEVVKVGDGSWGYRNYDFVKLIRYFETNTVWKYSGESDMIISNYTLHNDNIIIDYGSAITINLEKALENKAFQSVMVLINDISKFAKKYNGKNPTLDFSVERFGRIVRRTIWDYLLSFLPESLRKTPVNFNTYLLVDIRKQVDDN